jgi:hypothetical protein
MATNTNCKHCGNDTRPTFESMLRDTAGDGDQSAKLVLGNRYITGHLAGESDCEGFYDDYELQGRKRPRLIASRLTERGATELLDQPWKETK